MDIRRIGLVETLLQPKFHKKVSTHQAPAKEEIVRTTKYVLTHQNLDAQGEIVTDLVKVFSILFQFYRIQTLFRVMFFHQVPVV